MRRMTQRGFTLIELVVVITILGILAAFAVPKFLSLDSQARKAALQGIAGSVRSASMLAHSMSLVNGGVVSIDGTTITMVASGYPAATAAGIGNTLQDITGFTPAAGPPYKFSKDGGGLNCFVTYADTTTPPTVTVTDTSC